MIKSTDCKLTLEQRISRLENAVKSTRNNVRRKFEDVDRDQLVADAKELKDLAKEIVAAIKLNLGPESGLIVASTVDPEDFIRIYIEGNDYEISDEHCLLFNIYATDGHFKIVDDYTVYGHTYRARNVDEVVSIITRLVNNYFADRA